MRWWWFFFLPSVAAFSVRDCMSPDWACEYMERHNKTYASKEEFARRLVPLQESRVRLQHMHVHHGRRLQGVTFELGPYADALQRVRNRHLDDDQHLQRKRRKLRETPGSIPYAFDWRAFGFETPVLMQGDCGGCFAFAAATVLEYWNQKWRGGEARAVSVQAAMDCTSRSAGGQSEGCDGGLMEDVFEYAEHHALPYETEDPYVGRDAKCRSGSVNDFVSSYGVITKEDDPYAEEHIAWLVANYGPVAVSVDSRSDAFQHYNGGIFPASLCENDVDHAMTVVGFTPTYWILKNSWGPSWGERGYMRLQRGRNACGINEYITYVRSVHA